MSKKGKPTHNKPKLVKSAGFDVGGDSPWFMQGKKGFQRCHESHPTLSLGGGTFVGASCTDPRDGFDVYVGLDHGMRRMASYPWEAPSKIVEVYFPITDGCAPKNAAQFTKMITWLVEQLALGKAIHVGCLGGHGRTGLLLAALIKVIHGDANAGEWVRKNYCKSAIETATQTKFLKDHFGIEPVAGSKEGFLVSQSSVFDYGGPMVSSFAPMAGRSFWDPAWVST